LLGLKRRFVQQETFKLNKVSTPTKDQSVVHNERLSNAQQLGLAKNKRRRLADQDGCGASPE